jgi:hypothetical protein
MAETQSTPEHPQAEQFQPLEIEATIDSNTHFPERLDEEIDRLSSAIMPKLIGATEQVDQNPTEDPLKISVITGFPGVGEINRAESSRSWGADRVINQLVPKLVKQFENETGKTAKGVIIVLNTV